MPSPCGLWLLRCSVVVNRPAVMCCWLEQIPEVPDASHLHSRQAQSQAQHPAVICMQLSRLSDDACVWHTLCREAKAV